MRKRKYSSLQNSRVKEDYSRRNNQAKQHHEEASVEENDTPIPLCHNIVSTSQIKTTLKEINLQRLASLFPFTSYDRKRFAAITIRLAHPHCTCLLFGSGKLVITGSTSFHACLVASQTITEMLREVNPRDRFEVISCVIQNIVAHVELQRHQKINLEALYSKYCEHATYQRTIFPGLVLRPPESPIVLLIFRSGRIVCTGGKSYDDIYYGFVKMFKVLKNYIYEPVSLHKAMDINEGEELADEGDASS